MQSSLVLYAHAISNDGDKEETFYLCVCVPVPSKDHHPWQCSGLLDSGYNLSCNRAFNPSSTILTAEPFHGDRVISGWDGREYTLRMHYKDVTNLITEQPTLFLLHMNISLTSTLSVGDGKKTLSSLPLSLQVLMEKKKIGEQWREDWSLWFFFFFLSF